MMPGATGMATETLHETALQRARREFTPVFVHLPGLVCSALWAAVATGTTIYLSEGHRVGAKVFIGVGLLLGAIPLSAATVFGWLWATAPTRQRDEARAELARAEERFPRGRISVKDIGYFDKDGERLLLFAVKVTNRELTQRMNLEFDFYLRVLATISKLSPGLKPLDMRLRRAEHPKANPPDPLIVDAQDSSPELNYLVKSDEFADALDFDDGGHGFRPKSEDDQLLLRFSIFRLAGGLRSKSLACGSRDRSTAVSR